MMFLKAAVSLAENAVYSLHKTSTREVRPAITISKFNCQLWNQGNMGHITHMSTCKGNA